MELLYCLKQFGSEVLLVQAVQGIIF